MTQPGARIDFESVWDVIDRVPGWLTADQAYVLFRLARSARGAPIVEIGSHEGRSTLALSLAGSDVDLTTVDPFVTGRLFDGPSVRQRLLVNLEDAEVSERVTLLTTTSRAALASWPPERSLALVYVDGKHDFVSLLLDLRWAKLVRDGGHVAVHDMFSSVGVTVGALLALPFARRLALSHRVGSLAVLEVRHPSVRERLRPLSHVPWFLRNVAIKICLRLGLTPVARAMGHTDRFDPY